MSTVPDQQPMSTEERIARLEAMCESNDQAIRLLAIEVRQQQEILAGFSKALHGMTEVLTAHRRQLELMSGRPPRLPGTTLN